MAVARSARAAARPEPPVPDEVLRFRASERHVHWAVAVPFMVSYLTAVVLVAVYNPDPERPFREVVSLIHKISGVCLIVLPLATVWWHRRDFGAHLDNIRRAWSWSWGDVRWLMLMGPASLNKKIALPHQGKFNAAEKINFMVLVSTYPLYIVTGLLIWMPGVAIVAWFLHFGMAVAATPLILGHIFMATINPDTRIGLSGMLSGWVDRQWARHHYRLWYEERFGGDAVDAGPGGDARPAPPPAPRPLPRPLPRPATTAVARPAARPTARPATRPATRPAMPQVAAPVSPSATRPTPRPAAVHPLPAGLPPALRPLSLSEIAPAAEPGAKAG